MSELVIAEKNDLVNIANEIRQLTGQTKGLNLQEMQTGLKSIDNQPDWNQNDPNAKDYIKNRPGGYAVAPSVEITWDGDTTGKETIVVPNNGTLVKIADEAPSIEKFTVGTHYRAIIMAETTYSDGSNETVQKQIDLSYGGDFWMGQSSSPFCMAMGVTVDSVRIDSLTLTKGLWFSIADGVEMAKVITCGISTTDGGVKKFPESFIPNEVLSRISDAQDMAETAQNTASEAKSTALTVQSIAQTAQSTANTAKTTAETAQNTANTAKTTAEKAKSTANTAVKPTKQNENDCWYSMYNQYAQNKTTTMALGSTGGAALIIKVNEKHPSVAFIPPAHGLDQADFEFRRTTSAYRHPLITGIGGIVVYSSTPHSTKKFKITVDDAGVISATEVTS